jgi:TPR repeat protein
MKEGEHHNAFPLERRPSSAVEKAAPGAKRILSAMVADILTVAHVDLDALVLEGKRIRRRQGMTPEDIRAFDLFNRAAVAGHSEAQLLVYECYLDGHGVGADLAQSLEWFHKSAESGYAIAQCRLGDFYQGTKDYSAAVRWYRKAAEQGDASAQCSLGLCYLGGEGVPIDHSEAVTWTRKAAEQGNAIAQKILGVFYDEGHGVPHNYAEAVRWYRKAAEQGLAGAQNDLGVCYETGQGVPQDINEAVTWYRKAAEQGNVEAQQNLGACYANGRAAIDIASGMGGAIDAYQYVKIAEEKGCEGAAKTVDVISALLSPDELREAERRYQDLKSRCNNNAEETADQALQTRPPQVFLVDNAAELERWYQLGNRYYFGKDAAKNAVEAAKWYRKAAEQNHVEAQRSLGNCYFDGEGVPKDYVEALKWYRKAADKHDAGAEFRLGYCYREGEGVPKDYVEAVMWFRRAAEHGSGRQAQFNLGVFYERGEGVARDYTEATKWYQLHRCA